MATLKNKRKLAAVSRETPENARNSLSQNTLDPEMVQEYISQVSEEIEGRVTKKLSKEFSPTESRILGALSKLDEYVLNPQVRNCSVAVPGTSRNSDSGNRETNGDRSPNDPSPKAMVSSHHSGNLNSSEMEDSPHKNLEIFHNLNVWQTVSWMRSKWYYFLKMSFQFFFEVFLVKKQKSFEGGKIMKYDQETEYFFKKTLSFKRFYQNAKAQNMPVVAGRRVWSPISTFPIWSE